MDNEPITQEEIEEANQLLKGLDPDSVPIQSKIKGFTPLPDSIAETHGLIRAAVFGKVWRYCQMRDGVCRASLETIAGGLGIDRSTVSRHVEVLCKDHYLKDLTPLLKNKPHVYADTGKMKFTIGLTVAECNVGGETVAERNVTVAESRMSKESKRDSKKEELYPLARALSEVCHIDLKANRGRLFREAKQLSTATPLPTPELILAQYNGSPSAFWKSTDWRGKKGQLPTPAAIRETWGQWQVSSAPAYASTTEEIQAEFARMNPGKENPSVTWARIVAKKAAEAAK